MTIETTDTADRDQLKALFEGTEARARIFSIRFDGLEIDRSGIFSMPMTAVHSRKDLTFKNPP